MIMGMLASPLFLELTMSYYYSGKIGETHVPFKFKYAETAEFFGSWLNQVQDCNDPVCVPQADFEYSNQKWGTPDSPYYEYSLSVYRACDRLLPYRRCIFHGAAFLWHGKAYVFTAPSGTGKSTQLSHWMTLFGDEIRIMNGDKPVFSLDNGSITVMPSPWKGKERLGDDTLEAPLGGIIILEQQTSNSILKLTAPESVPFLLQRILFTAETKELVLQACKIIESIITTVPVWKLMNVGDEASARLTYETLRKESNG